MRSLATLDLLNFICCYMKGGGYWADGDGVLLEEAGLPVVNEEDSPMGDPPSRLERVGLDMRCTDDLVAALQNLWTNALSPMTRTWVRFQLEKMAPQPSPYQWSSP